MRIVSPFPAIGAGELHRWLNDPREPNFSDGVSSDAQSVAAMLEAKTSGGQTFALSIDGLAIGFLAIYDGDARQGIFAGMVMAPEYRGRRLGTAFLRSVVTALRAQGYRKLTAVFFADNQSIMQTFKNAGALETGYIHGAAMRGGQLVDARVWTFGEGGE